MIKLNIGGEIFTVSVSTLTSVCVPNYFSNYLSWHPDSTYIFVDRDPKYFHYILNHLRGYTITLPDDEGDVIRLYEDCIFYCITTLKNNLEEKLGYKLSDQNKKNIISKIKVNVSSNNIKSFFPILNLLPQMSDKELMETFKKVNSQIEKKTYFENINKIVEDLYKISKRNSEEEKITRENIRKHIIQIKDENILTLLTLITSVL
jgi:hypothetical protein